MTVRASYENHRDSVDELGRTKLHYAANIGATAKIKLLLDEGIDIDVQDDIGWTALHFAAQNNKFETIALLLAHKANPNLHDNQGNGPLWTAAMNAKGKYQGILSLLKAHADPQHKNKHGRSPLYIAKTLDHGLGDVFSLYSAKEV